MASVAYDHSVVASSTIPLYVFPVFIASDGSPFLLFSLQRSESLFNLSIMPLTDKLILEEYEAMNSEQLLGFCISMKANISLIPVLF